MTDRYVRSTDGSDADTGLTWALADATLTGAAAGDAAGDRIFLSQVHAESTASALNIALAGTINNPVQVLCGNDAAQPPTALATTASVATTGAASGLAISGHAFLYGINFVLTDGGNMTLCGSSDASQTYEKCTFQILGSGSTSKIGPNVNLGSNCSVLRWKSCDVKFGSAQQRLVPTTALWYWDGGSVLPSAVSPLALFENTAFSKMGTILASGLDLSNLASTADLFAGRTVGVIRNSKLPASWSGSLYSGTITAGVRVEMYNCDSGDTNYRIAVKDFTGDLTQETTIVKSAGASDGTTALSWKITASANCNFFSGRFYSPEIAKWNDVVGSAITATIEIIHDSTTALKDDEVWLDVQYLGTSGFPLGSFISDEKADVLATAANQSSSSETWTTTGLANPNKQKLSVTFTPQEKGYLHVRVCMGKASYTIYVDPLLTVT